MIANLLFHNVFIPVPKPIEQKPITITSPTTSKFIYGYYFKQQQQQPCDTVIIVSHGSAKDIYSTYGLCEKLFSISKCDVLLYEYDGFGPSYNILQPSEAAVLACADCAMEYVQLCKYKNIVVYGSSLGTAPSMYLASKYATSVCKLILKSPLRSISKTKAFWVSTWLFDMFDNDSNVPKIEAQVLLFHGTADRIVPFDHGKWIWKHCKNKYCAYWVEGADHAGKRDVVKAFGFDQFLILVSDFVHATSVPKDKEIFVPEKK